MSRKMRRAVFYMVLLAAGVTLGMQMGEPGTSPSGAYNPSYAQVNTGHGGVWSNGYEYGSTGNQPAWTNGNGSPGYQGIAPGYPGNGYYIDPQSQAGSPQHQQQLPGTGAMPTPGQLLMPPAEAPAVDQIADKTANLLQQMSKRGIRWFASWFGTDKE
ncbi:hypothetical protein [Paenibacillus aceti]|uniref:Uncharacterized protein n=1 Tax=Paenibacillus aceti TaxID=1820010 RepID=A0ABQ1VN93_9BACL|nr:hypothetical protein [Paenibacillus aceti]GGF83498.1 hypothetical protein GCM10010913_01250 [Paenibacillus aceti]